MIRLLAQRSELADKNGRMSQAWWTFFSEWVRDYNKKSSQWSGELSSHTGSTAATELASFSINIGKSGIATISLLMSATNNANAKTIVVKANGVDANTITLSPSTATQSVQLILTARSASQAYCGAVSAQNCTPTATTVAIDTTDSITVTVYGSLSVDTDTVGLESWAVSATQG